MPEELYRETDGVFIVRAWSETRASGKRRFRVRTGFCEGGRKVTVECHSAEEARSEARAVWRMYQRGELRPPERRPATIGELVAMYCARDDLAKSTRANAANILGRFVQRVGDGRRMHSVTPAMVAGWLESLPLKPSSLETYRMRVQSVYSWAVDKGWTDENPAVALRVRVPYTGVLPYLEAHEWAAFLAACTPRHRIRAEFALETGLRAGEMAHARWEWLHTAIGRQSLSVPVGEDWQPKTGRSRAVPLSDRAVEVLADAREEFGPDGYVFSDTGRPLVRQNLSKLTKQACKRAGLPPVTFHSHRRSAGARWLQAGLTLLEVSRLLGHSNITTTARHYAHIADRDLALAIGQIGERPQVVALRRVEG